MRIRKIRNIESADDKRARFSFGRRAWPLLFTSQLSGMGCGGRTMLDSLLTVNTVSGSTGTSGQNAGGMGGTQGGGDSQPEGGRQSGLRQHGGASMGDAVSGGASGSGSHPLWRKSSQPFCSSLGSSVGSLHVWSDARGAFVLASLDGEAKLPTVSTNISTNTGSGWNTTYTWSGYILIGHLV